MPEISKDSSVDVLLRMVGLSREERNAIQEEGGFENIELLMYFDMEAKDELSLSFGVCIGMCHLIRVSMS